MTVSQSRRLDLDAVAARYPATERPELYTLAPDTKAVRRHLPPAELDDLMTVVGEPRVGVK